MTSNEDISATMIRRARCLRAARYSMDTASNIKMLSEDIASGDSPIDALADTFSLLRLWTWIDRVEALSNAEDLDDTFGWPAKGLLDAGAWQLLGFDTDVSTADKVTFSETLACNVYDSPTRRYVFFFMIFTQAQQIKILNRSPFLFVTVLRRPHVDGLASMI